MTSIGVVIGYTIVQHNLKNSARAESARETSLLHWLSLVEEEYGPLSLEVGMVLLDLEDEYDSNGQLELAEAVQRRANDILVRFVRHSRFRPYTPVASAESWRRRSHQHFRCANRANRPSA